MTPQEVFDKVARHLLTQNERSTISEPINDQIRGMHIRTWCAYRSPRGLKCAVGCIIPDDVYTPDIEGDSIRVLIDRAAGASSRNGFSLTDKQTAFFRDIQDSRHLLSKLQSMHDVEDPSTWRRSLSTIARNFNLSDAVLEEV